MQCALDRQADHTVIRFESGGGTLNRARSKQTNSAVLEKSWGVEEVQPLYKTENWNSVELKKKKKVELK